MTISDEGLDTLVLRLYRGVRIVPFAQFHDWALRLIKPALNFDTAIWGLGIHDERGTFISSIHLHALPPGMMDDYAKVQSLDTVAERITAQLGRTVCASWDDPELATERYAAMFAYQRKYGMAHLLSTALPDPVLGLGHFLSLFRSDPARPWTEASRHFKERLFPHLTEAYMQARCLHMKQNGGAERGYVIADRTLRVANVTPVFRELMLCEWPGWVDSRMPPEVCAAWSGKARSYYKGRHVIIGMESDQQLVHLMARRCNALDVLTARELGVARLFARGLAHKDVAKEMGVSPHTVRNQIKAVYLKLGVSNKTSLANCLEDLS